MNGKYLSKDGVLAIKPLTRRESEEKLAGVVILPSVGHGKEASEAETKPRVDLVFEGRAIDGFA